MLRGEKIEFRTGAGIVADSRPEAELAETRDKARGLLRALGNES
jgi:anthranilate synthase component 1